MRYYKGNGIKVPQPKIVSYIQEYRKKIAYRLENWVGFFLSTGTFIRYSRVEHYLAFWQKKEMTGFDVFPLINDACIHDIAFDGCYWWSVLCERRK